MMEDEMVCKVSVCL